MCFDEKALLCVIPKSSIGHHNKSYDYENDIKNRQKPKCQWKSGRRQCRSH